MYEVPEPVLPRPSADPNVKRVNPHAAQLKFMYDASAYSFNISRTSTGEVLITTASHPLIFESQHFHVKTTLAPAANIYGLWEHSHAFWLNLARATRTLWPCDSYAIPQRTNRYGVYRVYF
jgi:alpha-glucosidase